MLVADTTAAYASLVAFYVTYHAVAIAVCVCLRLVCAGLESAGGTETHT